MLGAVEEATGIDFNKVETVEAAKEKQNLFMLMQMIATNGVK